MLQVKNVSANYDSSKTILKDITFNLEDNCSIAIVGPSGCGKSTLLKLIDKKILPTRGKILLDGQENYQTKKRIGIVAQQQSLFPWLTVKQNVIFGPKSNKVDSNEVEKEANELLQAVELFDQKDKHVFDLSGGQIQRVMLIRVLINHPQLLLLDEPFGALDPSTRLRIQNVLLNQWKKDKFSMLIVTHDVNEAIKLGQKIIILNNEPTEIIKIIDNQCFNQNDNLMIKKLKDEIFNLI